MGQTDETAETGRNNMRKSLYVLAAGLIFGSMAQADEATWKWDGELRTRFEADWNKNMNEKDSNDAMNTWYQRAKIGTTVAKGENLTGYVSVIAGFLWGNHLPSDNTAANGFTDGGNGDDNVMKVHEAWAWWRANDMFSLKIGRGAMEMAHGLVVAKRDYAQYPYVFDGVLGTIDLNFGTFGLFGVKGEDTQAAGALTDDAETVYYGLTFGMKNLPDAISTVHAHYFQINQDAQGNPNTDFRGARYGIALGGATMGIDWRLDYAAVSGSLYDTTADADVTDDDDVSVASSMIDLEVGYTLANVMNLRFFGTYHTDTGDDSGEADDFKRYNGFYYDVHRYAGLMDNFEFGNLTFFGLGASLEPMEGVTTGIAYYSFTRTTEDDTEGTAGDIRTGTFAGTADTDETALGSEIDLWVEKAYEGGFSLGLRFGYFTPGAYFDESSGNASDMELTAKLDF